MERERERDMDGWMDGRIRMDAMDGWMDAEEDGQAEWRCPGSRYSRCLSDAAHQQLAPSKA
jgi:hypothetical protein